MPKKIKKIVIKDEDIKREERPKLLIATPNVWRHVYGPLHGWGSCNH
jgi:hypothetical protein